MNRLGIVLWSRQRRPLAVSFRSGSPLKGEGIPRFFDVKKGGIRTKGKDSLVQNSLLFVLAAKRSGFYIHTTFHLPNGEKCKQL